MPEKNICPTCGKEFKSAKGMKVHHGLVHGKSIAGVKTKCKQCGKEYRVRKAKVKESKFCSKECYQTYQKNRKKEVKCDWCGKKFIKTKYEFEKTDNHYCSSECYHKADKKYEKKECKGCGKLFYPSMNGGEQKYCSRECYLKVHENKVEKVCVGCGKKFEVPKSNADRYNYCSFECKKKYSLGEYRECKYCGNEFYVKSNEVREGRNRQCCSRRCSLKYKGETGLEKKVRKTLDMLDINYKQEYPLLGFHIDFALIGEKLAIEADGNYWHSFPSAIKKDKRRDKKLLQNGWETIRIKGSTIKNHDNLGELIKNKIEDISGKEIDFVECKQRQLSLFDMVG